MSTLIIDQKLKSQEKYGRDQWKFYHDKTNLEQKPCRVSLQLTTIYQENGLCQQRCVSNANDPSIKTVSWQFSIVDYSLSRFICFCP